MRNLLVLLAVCALTTPLVAEIGPPVDLATRARGAGKVVVARVVDVQSTFGTNAFGDRLIISTVSLDVEETLKGAHEQVVMLTLEGGTVGDLTLRVSDLPSVQVGERAVLFVERTPRGENVPHRRGLGILKLDAANLVDGTTITLDQIKQTVRGASAQGRGAR